MSKYGQLQKNAINSLVALGDSHPVTPLDALRKGIGIWDVYGVKRAKKGRES